MSRLVVSDPHGYFDHLMKAINDKGGLGDKQLVLVGDALDAGPDAVKMMNFLTELHNKGRLIYIRGNHEDLFTEALDELENAKTQDEVMNIALWSHHAENKTFDTLLQLSGLSEDEAIYDPKKLVSLVKATPFYRVLLPSAVDYFETDSYVITHGWIPSFVKTVNYESVYHYNPDWRLASEEEWLRARWHNGMRLAHRYGDIIPNKTIICGHYHASYGHSCIDYTSVEFGPYADNSPYYGKGIIAIDGNVKGGGMINCIEIE